MFCSFRYSLKYSLATLFLAVFKIIYLPPIPQCFAQLEKRKRDVAGAHLTVILHAHPTDYSLHNLQVTFLVDILLAN